MEGAEKPHADKYRESDLTLDWPLGNLFALAGLELAARPLYSGPMLACISVDFLFSVVGRY
jgi:hypothetical protein